MRRTKIVATIGPACDDPAVLESLLAAGANVVRLNLSHGCIEEHRARIIQVREVAARLGLNVAILVDTKGPEIRLGTFEGGRVELVAGQEFILTSRTVQGDARRVTVGYDRLEDFVAVGSTILLDDGNIILEIQSVADEEIVCRVIEGGPLSDRKKVNLPGIDVPLPILSEYDREALAMAVAEGIDFVAVSFARTAADMVAVRRTIETLDGDQHLIAKIESTQGVQNLDEILRASDGLMVARGDLGVELPAEEVPILQKAFIEKCLSAGKPVITATQMLESMIIKPRPTRAEASDVANAIFDGTDAVMLSAETATGQHPVEAVATMARIAARTERALNHQLFLARRQQAAGKSVTNAIGHATCTIAADLGAAAIVTATTSGHTARMVACYRPRCPIVAATTDPRTLRKLALTWGVRPVLVEATTNTDAIVDRAVEASVEAGLVSSGDLVVITAGVPAGIAGTTNLLKVQTVGDVLLRGQGIGQLDGSGRACVTRNAREAREKFRSGDVLVTTATDQDYMELLRKAGGIIVEEGGLTSHAAIVALNLGIPAVVGASGAVGLIEDGEVVTVDGRRGLVYRGMARVL
ncbi:MAG: pyruvate kinase [Bacillota bacterium]